MLKEETITINVKKKTWKMLMDRKQQPSHTFDDIIQEALLDVPEAEEDEQ